MQKALNEVYDAGGGKVEVAYGIYPLKTTMSFRREEAKTVDISLVGLKNPAGERPQFYCDSEPGKTHRMMMFRAGYLPKSALSMSVSGLEIVGNNVPVNRSTSNVPGDDGVSPPWAILPWRDLPDNLHYGHPFMHHRAASGEGLMFLNQKTVHVDDVVIRNIYGVGIQLSSYGGRDDQRMESPTITNSKIINTWAWRDGFMTGDGIMLWFINNPRIENCVIYNDIPYTRWVGRSGIVVEHYSEGAIVKNNIIGGYSRNIHIEDTYGNHQVIGNKILASDFGVFLNEPDWKDATKMAKVRPVVIKDNYFEYNMERVTYKTFPWGSRRAFVDTFLLTKKLNGLQVLKNDFVYNDGKPSPKNPQIYFGPVEAKDYAAHGFTLKDNKFN